MNNDTISRQDLLSKINRIDRLPMLVDGNLIYVVPRENVNKIIKNMPSVQPEQLTDKEQRIFLAAMGREEKVCKQVDDECRDCREPYEDSLVRTCHEIIRKVKGALWT